MKDFILLRSIAGRLAGDVIRGQWQAGMFRTVDGVWLPSIAPCDVAELPVASRSVIARIRARGAGK